MTIVHKYSEIFPLYPSKDMAKDSPESSNELLFSVQRRIMDTESDWGLELWRVGFKFLSRYVHSGDTFTRYRGELERFFLWCMLIKRTSPFELSSLVLAEYFEFLRKPPNDWVSNIVRPRLLNGEFNGMWKPFLARGSSDPSNRSMLAAANALSTFYTYSIDADLCIKNPVKKARTISRYFQSSSQIQATESRKALTSKQWDLLVKAVSRLADKESKHERTLFLIVSIKLLEITISDLSMKDAYTPSFADFRDGGDHWRLRVSRNGVSTHIDVPVEYIPYLIRYRCYRGLSELPLDDEASPIISAIQNGASRIDMSSEVDGVTRRQLSRIVKQALTAAQKYCVRIGDRESNDFFVNAKVGWVRT